MTPAPPQPIGARIREPSFSQRSPALNLVWRWLPGIALLTTVAVLTMTVQTSPAQILLYWAVLVWSVLVPGMLTFRALRGRPTTLIADLAFGGATGLMLQLIAWAAFTAVGIQHWLIAWPIPLLAVFVAVPRLRIAWTIAPYERRLNPATSMGLVLASLVLVQEAIKTSQETPLPPTSSRWYQDLYWHLSIVGELMRAVPPQTPDIAGRGLSYHWFANAHMAAMTLSTGLDTPLVFTRLWMPPILVLAVLAIAAVGLHLTGRVWPGALAALMAAAGLRILTVWFGIFGTVAFAPLSPSLQFSVPAMMLALPPLIDVFRGNRLGWRGWTLLGLALLGAAGAKGTVLPVLLCGIALAAFVAVLVNRTLALRGLVALAFTGLATIVTWPLIADGAGGARIQIFSTAWALTPWVDLAGSSLGLGFFPPGIGYRGAWTLLVLLFLTHLLAHAWVLVGLPSLSRKDLSGWFLLGIGAGGFGALMLIGQDGLSQGYFMASALPALCLLAAWGFSKLVSASSASSRPWTTPALVTVFGAVGTLTSASLSNAVARPDGAERINSTLALVLAPWAIIAVTVLVVLIATSIRLRRARRLASQIRLCAAALIVGAAFGTAGMSSRLLVDPVSRVSTLTTIAVCGVAATVLLVARANRVPRSQLLVARVKRFCSWFLVVAVSGSGVALVLMPPEPTPPVTTNKAALTQPAEARAARWLRDNSDPDDIVATNVHCIAKATVKHCDSRGYWVAAISERRILVGGWAYTPPAHAAHGVDGYASSRQPFDDEALFAANEAAFYAPTPERLDALRGKGVRFLFADSLAGRVSPQLANLATVVHTDGPVTIYRLSG